MVWEFLKGKLGIREIEKALIEHEKRLEVLDREIAEARGKMTQMDFTLVAYGSYKTRTEEELKLMRQQIEQFMTTADEIVTALEYNEGIERAKALRRRLRNNLTRINGQLQIIQG